MAVKSFSLIFQMTVDNKSCPSLSYFNFCHIYFNSFNILPIKMALAIFSSCSYSLYLSFVHIYYSGEHIATFLYYKCSFSWQHPLLIIEVALYFYFPAFAFLQWNGLRKVKSESKTYFSVLTLRKLQFLFCIVYNLLKESLQI